MTQKYFETIRKKMEEQGCSELCIKNFEHNYQKLLGGDTGKIAASEMVLVEEVSKMPDPESVYSDVGVRALSKLAIIKLNGGLGTTMGLSNAKSMLPVKSGKTFLDIIIQQIRSFRSRSHADIPVLFMNSFRTDQETLSALRQYPDLESGQNGIPLSFLQNQVPKINSQDFSVPEWKDNPELEWCPPGHGDIYVALLQSGVLEELLSKGIEYAFISNSDNLGATLNPNIFGYLITKELSFLMEVATRTEADKKGGHLGRGANERLLLRELAQCPEEEHADFQNTEKYKFFNTNSLWISLQALQDLLEDSGGVMDLPLIQNRKSIDSQRPESLPVVQLETAMGAAISSFENSGAILVPRSRFRPVKTTNDLFVLRSGLMELSDSGEMLEQKPGQAGNIAVDLDPQFFRVYGDFEARFQHGIPDINKCHSLKVTGNVYFGKDITLSGNVVIEHSGDTPLYIADGAEVKGD